MQLENVVSLSALMVKRVERHAKIEIQCVFKAQVGLCFNVWG